MIWIESLVPLLVPTVSVLPTTVRPASQTTHYTQLLMATKRVYLVDQLNILTLVAFVWPVILRVWNAMVDQIDNVLHVILIEHWSVGGPVESVSAAMESGTTGVTDLIVTLAVGHVMMPPRPADWVERMDTHMKAIMVCPYALRVSA